ncbi:MAG: hypothetical protein OJF47_001530 [Nitrospira sp.]|nr:MAG: hypothetical protein OJF47_001530 [Nitrospira sp.]
MIESSQPSAFGKIRFIPTSIQVLSQVCVPILLRSVADD